MQEELFQVLFFKIVSSFMKRLDLFVSLFEVRFALFDLLEAPEMSETPPDVVHDVIDEDRGIEEAHEEGMAHAVSHLRMKLTSAQVSDLHMQDAPSSIWNFDKANFVDSLISVSMLLPMFN